MLVKADLHIHSCLSPCASEEMLPTYVITRAFELGLDMIAITDHNSILNLEAFIDVAAFFELGKITVIPGIEVQSSEEVHLVCLFEKLDTSKIFYEYINAHLPNFKNDINLFGSQIIVDGTGQVIGSEDKLLLNSVNLTIEEIVNKANSLGGITIAAHIDRPAYSLLTLLGFIPPDLNLSALELSANADFNEYISTKPVTISSSDAHYLDDIGKVYSCFEGEISFSSLKKALKISKIKKQKNKRRY